MDSQPTRGDLPDAIPPRVQALPKGFILIKKIDLMITASAEEFKGSKDKPTKIFLVEDRTGEERKLIASGVKAIEKLDKLTENIMHTFRFVSKTNESDWAYIYGAGSMIKAST